MEYISALFSPTGTTAKIAQAIARGVGEPAREIDLTRPVQSETLPEGTGLVVSVPVYGGRVPVTARERLAALKGNGNPAAAVVVYGNRHYDDALLELTDLLTAQGFRVIAAGAFVAEHSIVHAMDPSHPDKTALRAVMDFGAGRPDEADLQAAMDFGTNLAAKLLDGDLSPVQVPGNPEYRAFNGLPFHPAAGENCAKCGACAAACPAGAIPAEDPSVTDADKCITCMRCVDICPSKARDIPKVVQKIFVSVLSKEVEGARPPEIFL